MSVDPKAAARERFASAAWNQQGMNVVMRCATDPPLVVRGLVDAIRERTQEGGRVCELGFGGGWLLEALVAEPFAAALVGLDLSAGMAASARERFHERVGIVQGDMEQLPFAPGAFDVIVTCWTLYFMNDIDRALAEMARCLTPAGRLIAAASTPDHEIECAELVAEASRCALGRDAADDDISVRFDLATGEEQLRRHFRKVEVRTWDGELVIASDRDIEALWPKWEPPLLPKAEQQAIRAEFLRLGRERLARDGLLRIRRRNGAFVCDREAL